MRLFALSLVICTLNAVSTLAAFVRVAVENSTHEVLLHNMQSLVEEVANVYMKGFNCIAWVQRSGSPIMSFSPHLPHLVVSLDDMSENNLLSQMFSFKCQGFGVARYLKLAPRSRIRSKQNSNS